MRKNNKEKNKLIGLICLLLFLALGLGYAILTEQLELQGSVNYGAITWDVGFTTAEDGGGTVSTISYISPDEKSVIVSCNIGKSTSSETCIVNAKIKNNSTFGVELESDPTISFENTYISSVTTKWVETNLDVKEDDSIGIGAEKEIQIVITTKELTKEMLPENDLSISVSVTMNWVEITYEEKAIFSDITSKITESDFTSDKVKSVTLTNSPFAYYNTTYFAGKHITKIGVPVKSVSAIDENQTFTVSVIKTTSDIYEFVNTYTLKLPVQELEGGDKDNINKWIYIDCDITLNDDETLGFGSSTDTTIWAYRPDLLNGEGYNFRNKTTNKWVNSASATAVSGGILFDVYYLEEPETTQVDLLKTALSGKNFSILGDSISTFTDYSSGSAATTTNSTITNNEVWYNTSERLDDVNKTWWMRTANSTGLNLLVNNSYSGDMVARLGMTRALQLHDDTGDNANTEPDIIAVFLGINDYDYNFPIEEYSESLYDTVIKDNGDGTFSYPTIENYDWTVNNSATNRMPFASAYIAMIHKIITKYENAEIFLFTLMPNTRRTEYEVLETYYNDVIRNVASHYNLNVVDLYEDSGITKDNLSTYTVDGLHPNALGMELLSNTFINKLEEVYLNAV